MNEHVNRSLSRVLIESDLWFQNKCILKEGIWISKYNTRDFLKTLPFNSLNVLLKARISHKYKIKQLINCPFELLQKLEWMFLDVRLKGPISSQWGCSSEGKQRLKRGIRHLTWFLGTARLSLGTKSSRRLKLFQNTLHSLSNYRVCPNKLHDGVLVGTKKTKKKPRLWRFKVCSKPLPNNMKLLMEEKTVGDVKLCWLRITWIVAAMGKSGSSVE